MSRALVRACPVCGGGEGEVLHTQSFVLPTGHPLSEGCDVVACVACGASFADSDVPQAAYDAFYERFSKYDDADTSTGSGGNPLDAQRLSDSADAIAAHISAQARVLDVGCAGGGLLSALRERGFDDLVGVDPSAACVAYGIEELSLEMHQGTLAALPEIGEFDLVILSHVLEHVGDVRGAVAAIRSILAEGGKLLIEVPDAMRYRDHLVSPFQDFNTEHINHFSAQSLCNLAALTGFHVVAGDQITLQASTDATYPAVWQIWQLARDQTSDVRPDTELSRQLIRYRDESRALLDSMNELLRPALAQPVVVWGTGQLALKLLAETVLRDAEIMCFVDGNPVFHGTTLATVPVVGPETLVDSDTPIVVASTVHATAITARIREDLKLGNPLITLA